MDQELKELGALALRNAFWKSFSALVNDTVRATDDLISSERQLQMLGEMTSVYGRAFPVGEPSLARPRILTFVGKTFLRSHHTMFDALNYGSADRIVLDNVNVFTRVNGEWMWDGG